jgi:cytochrome c-type biogenesis protein CcmH/NrfG
MAHSTTPAAPSPADLLQQARIALQASNWADAGALAVDALKLDETSDEGWRILAICREQQGDFGASLRCYETALKLLPDDADIAFGLGRLAFRLGFH